MRLSTTRLVDGTVIIRCIRTGRMIDLDWREARELERTLRSFHVEESRERQRSGVSDPDRLEPPATAGGMRAWRGHAPGEELT